MWTLSENKDWSYLESRFSWVEEMNHVPQDRFHHAEGNVAIHTRMVLEELHQDAVYNSLSDQEKEILWAAALLHDVEKRSTTVQEADGRISAKGHARKGAQTARRMLYKEEPAPFAIREQIWGLIQHHSLPLWLLERADPLKLLIQASLEVDTRWLTLLARADVLGRICEDQADLLYRVECFEEFCRENGCWGTTRPFASAHARMHYLQHKNSYPDYVPFDEPEMEVIMMSGLPGAGKDTYIRKHLSHLPVISLDAIRESLGSDPADKRGNGQAIQQGKEQARILLRKKQSFVWNATNITRQLRSQLIALFLSYKVRVRIIYLEVPFEKLQGQNKDREAVVPTQIIEKLAGKLEVPALWEAHEVTYVT